MKRVREEPGIFGHFIPADVWNVYILSFLSWSDLQRMVRVNKAFYALVRKHMIQVACIRYKNVVSETECIKARHYESWMGCDRIKRKQWRDYFPAIETNDNVYNYGLCDDEFQVYVALIGLLKKFGTIDVIIKEHNHQTLVRNANRVRWDEIHQVRIPMINTALKNNGFECWFFVRSFLLQQRRLVCISFRDITRWLKCDTPFANGKLLIEQFMNELHAVIDVPLRWY